MRTIVKKLTFKNGKTAVLTIEGRVMNGLPTVNSEPIPLDEVHELLGAGYSPVTRFTGQMFEWDFTVNPNVVKDETTAQGDWDFIEARTELI